MNDLSDRKTNDVGHRVRDPVEEDIARRLRDLRAFRGLKQGDVADRVGVSYQQLHKWEKGINRISCGALKKLADALDVEPGYFFHERGGTRSMSGHGDRQTMQFMDAMNQLSPDARKAIMTLAHALKDEGKSV